MSPAQTIISMTAREFGTLPHALATRSRDRRIVNARRLAAWLMREHTHMTLHQIAGATACDHVTVWQSVRRVVRLRSLDADFDAAAIKLSAELTARGVKRDAAMLARMAEAARIRRERRDERRAAREALKAQAAARAQAETEKRKPAAACFGFASGNNTAAYLIEQNERFAAAMREGP